MLNKLEVLGPNEVFNYPIFVFILFRVLDCQQIIHKICLEILNMLFLSHRILFSEEKIEIQSVSALKFDFFSIFLYIVLHLKNII